MEILSSDTRCRDHEHDTDEWSASKYELRPMPRLLNRDLSYWVDQDTSGDYEPKARRTQDERLKKRASRPLNLGDIPKKRPKHCSWLAGRQNGDTLIITLSFSSEAARARLHEFPIGSSHPCSESSDSNQGIPSLWLNEELYRSSRSLFHRGSQKDDDVWTSRHPTRLLRQPAGQSRSKFQFDDPLIGRPNARGCKACFELREVCSLVDDSSSYPCDLCDADEIECEQIVPPAKKRGCENCKRRRIKCSYREGGDHTKPCGSCSRAGLQCLAGPEITHLRTRRRFAPTEDRPHIACIACRQEKRWCSLNNLEKAPPCRFCSETGISCAFKRTEKLLSDSDDTIGEKDEAMPISEANIELYEHLPLESMDLDSAVSHFGPDSFGVSQIMRTSFAHPICFNDDSAEDDHGSCNWCEKKIFGLYGYGPVLVEVKCLGPSQGYTELAGGHHQQNGRKNTIMCSDCTNNRLGIITCPGHRIKEIDDTTLENLDYVAAYEELEAGPADPGRPVCKYWCSICPSPAFHSCYRKPELVEGISIISSDSSGCGLALCEDCAIELAEVFGNNLDEMIVSTLSGQYQNQRPLRADAVLLTQTGELMRHIMGTL